MDIKVNIELSLNPATQDFLKSILGNLNIAASSSTPAPASKPMPAPAPKPAPAPASKPAPAPAPESEGETAVDPDVTIEDVRAALSEKVNTHRDEIKAKLTELGAASVTRLDPSKYQEMYDFCKSL
jgi:hypothetical protein